MKVFGFICGLFALAGVACFFILPGWYLAGIIFVGVSLVSGVIHKLKTDRETKCGKCKKAYDYDTDVEYRIKKQWTQKGSNNVGDRWEQVFYQIEFACQCSDCGVSKRYTKKYPGPKIKNGEYSDVDIEGQIEGMFKNNQGELTFGTCILALLMGAIFLAGGIYFS